MDFRKYVSALLTALVCSAALVAASAKPKEISKRSLTTLMEQGEQALMAKDFKAARDDFSDILTADPQFHGVGGRNARAISNSKTTATPKRLSKKRWPCCRIPPGRWPSTERRYISIPKFRCIGQAADRIYDSDEQR